jgi:hypothetical protein
MLGQIPAPAPGESPRGSVLTNPKPGFCFQLLGIHRLEADKLGSAARQCDEVGVSSPGFPSHLQLGILFSSGQLWTLSFSTFKMGITILPFVISQEGNKVKRSIIASTVLRMRTITTIY